MRARFDLVGLDPRGIGASTPLRCFDTLDQALGVLPPFPFPVTAAEERLWVDADRTFARACARRGGPILDHMATADVARDLDLLRQAVGDRQLTYVGFSYGAYLGATYANLFPAKVRALVLDGVPDPVAWATGRGDQAATWPLFNRVGSAEGASATLGEFFRLCDQGGPACAFSQGDPRRRYQALARRLLANPVQTPDGPVGYADLIYATLLALQDPAAWPELAQRLQQLDSLTRQPTAAATRLGTSQPDYPNVLEGLPGVACSDSDNPDQVGAWQRAADASDRTAPYFGRYWTWSSSICQPWPGRDPDRYTGPWTAADRQPGPDRRQPIRPGHPLPGGGHPGPPAPPIPPAHPERLGPHLRRQILLHRRTHSPVPTHHPDPATRLRLPARPRAVRPPIGPDGRRPNQAREELTMRRASPVLLAGALARWRCWPGRPRSGRGTTRPLPPTAPRHRPPPNQLLIRQPSSGWWTGSWRPAPPAPSRWSALASGPGRGLSRGSCRQQSHYPEWRVRARSVAQAGTRPRRRSRSPLGWRHERSLS